jgi:FMN phosphatase YigB (HAD superfamily)
LVKSWSPRVLAGVPELVADLRLTKSVFVATNQGGPFWRLLTGQDKFPSPRRLVETMVEIAAATGLGDVPWYVAVHPGAKHASEKKLAIVEDVAVELQARLQGEAVFVRTPLVSAALDWRKPATGMLDAALSELGTGRLAYVGDLETDRELAANAGALFVDAAMWRAADEDGNPLSSL